MSYVWLASFAFDVSLFLFACLKPGAIDALVVEMQLA
jgi:hypothetical protein